MSILKYILCGALLIILADFAGAAGTISIDQVDGSDADTALVAGVNHRIHLRFDLTDVPPFSCGYVTSNTWIIHSPDGAHWLSATGTRDIMLRRQGAEAGTLDPSIAVFNRAWHKSGGLGLWSNQQVELPGTFTVGPTSGNVTGADSIAFQVITITGGCAGLPAGANEIAYIIEFSTIQNEIGRHICVDSTSQLGAWEWKSGPSPTQPDWTGHCFELVECCTGTTGDANGDGQFEPTVSDIGAIVDFLFISGVPPFCLPEADANQSGGASPTGADITVSDIGVLVDHLFITGAPLPVCP